jgi:AAA+ ATPase superfamily predicted ATPase
LDPETQEITILGSRIMSRFIGRLEELRKLTSEAEKKTASFIVVRGRRRIGKSRLVEEFSKRFEEFHVFTGMPPEKNVTKADQLQEFCRQMSRQFKTPLAIYNDWSDAFWALGERVRSGKVLILFDEISWMGSEDPTFLGKIKNLWDQFLKKNDKLVFVVCGSASAWIEKNILGSTGFVGRISYTLTLEELPLSDCSLFWPKNVSAYEKFKILSVTGGIPKYLEEVDPRLSAEENIKQLCFTKGGFLVEEFNQIFSDLFLRESAFYKKIIMELESGPKERTEICKALNIEPNGRISEYLHELQLAGFIKRDHTWNIVSGEDSKLSRFRLSDNYLRFYMKYIDPSLSKIDRSSYNFKSLTALPEWHSIMGFQFENLILNNRSHVHKSLNINPEDIITENPFFQRKTTTSPGCQIDYMIQARFGTLYVCEIKFSKNKLDSSVIQEVQNKIDRLQHIRGYSCRPVLIHVNGVTEDVIDSDFFASIIDASDFMK